MSAVLLMVAVSKHVSTLQAFTIAVVFQAIDSLMTIQHVKVIPIYSW